MPPSLEPWELAELPTTDIQDTLQTFTFDQSLARALRDGETGGTIQSKRSSTLAEHLLRVKTNLERAMAMDMVEASPRTIIPRQDDIMQSIEVEVIASSSTTRRSAGSRRSRASDAYDLPVSKTKRDVSEAMHTFEVADTQEVIIKYVEAEIEATGSHDKTCIETISGLAGPSREVTPDIVRSKFEASEMFSRVATPSAPASDHSLSQNDDEARKESLGHEDAGAEHDEKVRQKLQAITTTAPPTPVEAKTTNEEVAEDGNISMNNGHDEFLHSKLEAMGVIPIPPSPAHSSFSSSSISSNNTGEREVVKTADVYDQFLQSKLEAMGVITSRLSSSSHNSSAPTNTSHLKHSSQAEADVTSPPEIIVESIENTSQGDMDPPLSRAASSAAVSEMSADENMDVDEFLHVPSRCSSADMTTDETPSLTRDSSYSAFEDVLVDVRKESIVEIRSAQLIKPLSRLDNYTRPLPISKERTVVRDYLEIIEDQHNAEHAGHSFIEFDMDDYQIYLPASAIHHAFEMTGLQNMHQTGHQEYLIDGILSLDGEERRYVEGVPFKTLSVGTYGKEYEEVTGVWIQSNVNKRSDIHYRLRKPHRKYERFHTGFMWLANLAKNFVDYAIDREEAEQQVSIHNFRRDFYDWLLENHGNEKPFKKWYAEYGNPDFRTVIASNIDWLAKEAVGSWNLHFLDVFDEVRSSTKLPFHPAQEEMTIVTPFVYECFKEMNFGRFLKKVDPNPDTDFRRKSIGEALHLSTDQDVIEMDEEDGNDYERTTARLAKRSLEDFKSRPFDKSTIAVGDVLAVVKDSGHVSKWKSEKTKWSEIDECWFIYVQAIEQKHGKRAFRILWMYKPADTSCALMKYPYQDELFLSAHCECDQPEWITEDQVICRVSVAWNGNHGCKEDFFVRQRFHQLEISFTTLKESDKMCRHMCFEVTPAEEVQRQYTIGSTVLYQPKRLEEDQRQRLEPGAIMSFNEDEGITLRKLLRRSEADPTSNAAANELVYTDIKIDLRPDQIHHECQVRFYSSKDITEKTVPPPYSLNGASDFFYICTRQVVDILNNGPPRFEEIDPVNPPPSLIQGFYPKSPPPKNPMRGLDLFCGSGNMGRGLEDGGAVRFTHACDYQDNALASYYANTEDTEHTKFFAGSVNDLLKQAMDGNPSNITGVPLPGDIEFISAGSPCQGFSNMNPRKMTDEALRNQSLVADVASMVEFYRPKYAVLENVVAMAKKGDNRREDCLSQLVCCLVGMGYQLQINLLDAWSFGCPQRRQRLFVVVAAPDLAMPKPPHQSHSHPASMQNASLGVMANGLPFGQRIWTDTAFKWRSAEDATADLPDIGDGQTYHCTRFPDHRTPFDMKEQLRHQLAAIPLFPPGMNARKAWPKMSKQERDLFSVKSRKTGDKMEKTAEAMEHSFQRVMGGHLFHTITTKCAPAEKRNGKVAHWSQQRVITIMEAKRAQGFLDTDVLVGTKSEQYKIIGNSVARPVAIAQGMAIRKAWLQNEDDNPSLDAALVPITVRDDVAQLELPPASSSRSSELTYKRRTKGLESSNSEMEEESSVSTAPPRSRESRFSVAIPVRNSIVEFPSSPVQQAVGYQRSSTPSPSELPFTRASLASNAPTVSMTPAKAPAEKNNAEMCEASQVQERWQDLQQLPKSRPGMAEVKRSAKKRRRMMGGVTPASTASTRATSQSPAPVASMSRADVSILQASQKLAHLGRRRSQTNTPSVSRLGTPAVSRPASRPPFRLSQNTSQQGFSRNDKSIAQGAEQLAGVGRRRSQTTSQQVSRAASPHLEHDEHEEAPRTAKRRKLPNKPIVHGSADRPISLDDSDDEAAPMPMRMPVERARTYTPAPSLPPHMMRAELEARARIPQPRSGGWTAVNTPPPANAAMAQHLHVSRQATRNSQRPSPSPAPSRRCGTGTPRPRTKKVAKPKQPFVIDLTADDVMSDNGRGRVARRVITPYQPVDNSAWMGMLFTKDLNGGLRGKDVEQLLGMDMVDEAESAFEDVEAVRRAEAGEREAEEERRREVVYGY